MGSIKQNDLIAQDTFFFFITNEQVNSWWTNFSSITLILDFPLSIFKTKSCVILWDLP